MMNITRASKSQARKLAELIDRAGEGIPAWLWRDMAEPGQSALDVGALRASRDEGGFSYRNARVCEREGEVLGMCVSYQQPDPYDLSDLAEYPAVVRPLVELESRAPGSWYINALASFEAFEGQGVARALLGDAESQAGSADCSTMSLIVSTENQRAMKLYRQTGFAEADSLPVVGFPGSHFSGDWVLMIRSL